MHFQLTKNILKLSYFLPRNILFFSVFTARIPSSILKRISSNNISSLLNKNFSISMACCGNGCGLDLSKEALKKKLTSIQYQVTQESDTERPFSGKYCNHFEKGVYTCVVCNQDLFTSEAKFESKCGWPAFSDVINAENVKFKTDLSLDMKRTEVSCSKCGAHLGHVFDDGPKPTGKRYCINSASLDFKKAEDTPSTASS